MRAISIVLVFMLTVPSFGHAAKTCKNVFRPDGIWRGINDYADRSLSFLWTGTPGPYIDHDSYEFATRLQGEGIGGHDLLIRFRIDHTALIRLKVPAKFNFAKSSILLGSAEYTPSTRWINLFNVREERIRVITDVISPDGQSRSLTIGSDFKLADGRLITAELKLELEAGTLEKHDAWRFPYNIPIWRIKWNSRNSQAFRTYIKEKADD